MRDSSFDCRASSARRNFSTIRSLCTLLSLALAVFVTIPSNASAITIVRNFLGTGIFPLAGGVGTAEPGNAVGGGNLTAIVNAAADYWEAALLDTRVFTINFGWRALGASTIGVVSQYVIPQPGFGGDIQFESDGSNISFMDMDPTPYDNSEFNTLASSSDDLGGGVINVGRVYSDPNISPALNIDMLSIAKHEIDHLLGIADFFSFTTPTLTTTAPRPNAGTVIPTTALGGGHINIAPSLMFGTISTGIRRVQSGVDILAAAEANGFVNIDLSPNIVPEPDTALLLSLGLVGLAVKRRRQRSDTTKKVPATSCYWLRLSVYICPRSGQM